MVGCSKYSDDDKLIQVISKEKKADPMTMNVVLHEKKCQRVEKSMFVTKDHDACEVRYSVVDKKTGEAYFKKVKTVIRYVDGTYTMDR